MTKQLPLTRNSGPAGADPDQTVHTVCPLALRQNSDLRASEMLMQPQVKLRSIRIEFDPFCKVSAPAAPLIGISPGSISYRGLLRRFWHSDRLVRGS